MKYDHRINQCFYVYLNFIYHFLSAEGLCTGINAEHYPYTLLLLCARNSFLRPCPKWTVPLSNILVPEDLHKVATVVVLVIIYVLTYRLPLFTTKSMSAWFWQLIQIAYCIYSNTKRGFILKFRALI